MLIQCADSEALNLDNGVLTITCLDEDNEVVYENEYELDGLQLVQPAPTPSYLEGLDVPSGSTETNYWKPEGEGKYLVSDIQSSVEIDTSGTPSISGTSKLIENETVGSLNGYYIALDASNCDFTGYEAVFAIVNGGEYQAVLFSNNTKESCAVLQIAATDAVSTVGLKVQIMASESMQTPPVQIAEYDLSDIFLSNQ
jgi:hypothetical protein